MFVKVRDLLGISAVSLLKYGVEPDYDVIHAIKILGEKAPHLAKLLEAVMEETTRAFPNGG